MFTDVVGYSSLTQKDEALAMNLLEEHRKLVRRFVLMHNGREVKTIGDGFLLEFASALEAVRCAFDIQESLHELAPDQMALKQIKLRIGIHLGDIIQSRSDVFGDSINIASRIEPLSPPGGICVSEQVYDQIRNKFEFPLASLGKQKLKNIEQEIEVYNVVLPWNKEQVSPALGARRIAVLPFSNISPDPGDEYFADGMTEELTFCISKIKGLSVISRTSVMQYKNTENKRVTDIGRELNAGTLLEGSVRKAGNRVRIAVQLIDAVADEHLWGDEFDRELADVFSIQSEIAEKVAASLKIRLLSTEKHMIGNPATLDVDAYTLYLKGCYHLNRQSKESYLKAIELLEEATRKDPGFALAYSRLASTYAFLGLQGLSAEEYAFSKSEEYANTALKLDETLPDAHISLGFVLLYKWNLSGADLEFRRAIEINPNLAPAHVYYANLLYFSRRFDESVTEIRKALELDPLSAETSNWAGTAFLYAGHYDESIEQFRNALEIDPNIMMAQNNLGLAYIQKGLLETGLAEILKAVTLAGETGFPQVASDLGYAYAKMGRPEETRKVLQQLLALRDKSPESTQFAIPIASLYASLGEKEKAMDWLEEAYNKRSAFLISINTDLVFDGLRDEPRFVSLLKKIGL